MDFLESEVITKLKVQKNLWKNHMILSPWKIHPGNTTMEVEDAFPPKIGAMFGFRFSRVF